MGWCDQKTGPDAPAGLPSSAQLERDETAHRIRCRRAVSLHSQKMSQLGTFSFIRNTVGE